MVTVTGGEEPKYLLLKDERIVDEDGKVYREFKRETGSSSNAERKQYPKGTDEIRNKDLLG